MEKPALVIMAAGMGSRFGGLKQITPVDESGHAIIDYSLYDAYRAGFDRVVFIIKRENEADFKAAVGKRAEKHFQVDYVFQELGILPEGYGVPEGRVKPWGTAHAVACCRDVVKGPFAVINADDFYGAGAFEAVYGHLTGIKEKNHHAMVAYRLRNTVTENGSVSRGVCETVEGYLKSVTERTHIEKRGDDAAYTLDGGKSFTDISGDTLVSMNFWGFGPGIMESLWDYFPEFLDKGLKDAPLKCEYYLPAVASRQLDEGIASVRVLPCEESWLGVTYREDLPLVREKIEEMRRAGVYPANLLD